jgi:hypothetical protein
MRLNYPVMTCLAGLAALAAAAPASAGEKATAVQARSIAKDAYFYAYPLVLMDATMRQATNTSDAQATPGRAPVNQFAHLRAFPNGNSKDVLRPSFDALYSSAWLDLSREPVILSVPDTGGRYFFISLMDMWTDVFANPGKRISGSGSGVFAIVGPKWQGDLPKGIERIDAPDAIVRLVGRTSTTGADDYSNAYKIQFGYRLTPLSQWGKDAQPPANSPTDPSIDNSTPPLVQVNSLDGVGMLKKLAELLKKHSARPIDYTVLRRLKAIGFQTGSSFEPAKLTPDVVAAINQGAKDALRELTETQKKAGSVNGWTMTTDGAGVYGASYKRRAFTAMSGFGGDLPEDAVDANASADADGKPFTGSHGYVVHFDKDKLPPADAFWSITLYDAQGYPVSNPLDRHSLGSRDGLQFNGDGSVDIYVQSKSPRESKKSNWLPAPKEGFSLMMRLYAPKGDVLDGRWTPPAPKRAPGES